MTISRLTTMAVAAAITLTALGSAAMAAVSNVPASRLASLARGINADNVVNNTRMADYGGDDLRKLRAMGFTYIRIPIDPSFVIRSLPIERGEGLSDDSRVSFGLQRLDEHVEKFTRAGFAVMLALQPQKSFMALPTEESQARLLEATDVLTKRYAARYSPDQLFLETVNEPHYDNTTWNEFAPRLVAEIRQNAPRHTIIVPPAWWDLPTNFKDLTPIDDPDIVYTMHVYQPNALTTQGSGGGHHPDFRFPKPADSSDPTEWTEEKLDAYIRLGVDWADAHHVPLIMNEFGTTNVADRTSRLNWVQFMLAEADRYHFGWAWWAFDGRLFGLNPHGKGYDPDLVQLLSKR